eukprot:1938045-Rhodomonas_salina.1
MCIRDSTLSSANFKGAALVISHNQQFIEDVTTEKWAVEAGQGASPLWAYARPTPCPVLTRAMVLAPVLAVVLPVLICARGTVRRVGYRSV